jgi:23S rRNA (pseudouridine1915-N3)-methyltransferase
MRITIIAATNRQPDWIEQGYQEYARRLVSGCTLELRTVPLARRTRSSTADQAMAAEGERMLALLPKGAHVVALSEDGGGLSTAALAVRLDDWIRHGGPVCLLIGGPDGLPRRCLERAAERWSLSPLTLPHGLARVLVAEALYRAWSLRSGHPYHRP